MVDSTTEGVRLLDTEALVVEVDGEQLKEITDDFFRELGNGGYGTVYYGTLKGNEVAVKVLKAKNLNRSGFQTELDVLLTQRHSYIVMLRAFCREPPALVYEFLPGGDLQAKIKSFPDSFVSWKDRIRMAYEICMGLRYLHDQKPQAILHLDLKPANILLDADGHCKLADVGLAKFSNASVTARGTPGFMDPHLLHTGRVNKMSDIYSLGRTLLHLFTGISRSEQLYELTKKFNESDEAWQAGLNENVPKGFFRWRTGNKAPELLVLVVKNLDKHAGKWPSLIGRKVARLALECSSRHPRRRPEIERVCRVLEYLMEASESLSVSADIGIGITKAIRGSATSSFFYAVHRVIAGRYGPTSPPKDVKHHTALQTNHLDQQRKGTNTSAGVEELRVAPLQPSGQQSVRVAKLASAGVEARLLESGPHIRHFTLDELKVATSNFDPRKVVQETEWYVMTSGVMKLSAFAGDSELVSEETRVVVKKVQPQVLANYDMFLQMVLLLNQVQHPNLEHLLGYCHQGPENFFVFQGYERTLEDEMQHTNLSWRKRLQVSLNIAEGLACLHANNVIHRSLRPSVILLSKEGVAVISGWESSGELSRDANRSVTICSTVCLGNLGYQDPSYIMTGHITRHSDIFSLGIILLEVLSGRRACKENLIRWSRPLLEEKLKVEKLVDPRLGIDYQKRQAVGLAKLIMGCIHQDPGSRPTATVVAGLLGKLLVLGKAVLG